MQFTLVTAAVVAGLFGSCICEEVAGYSELANDLVAPLSAMSDSSPNLMRSIFSRQKQWCTAGSPYVICPTPRTCCNARDNCTPTGCCPKIAETCGGKFCAQPGSVCCGNSVCKQGASCKLSAGGQNVCCRSATDVACGGYCCSAGYSCTGGGLCRKVQTSISRSTSTSHSTSTSWSTSTSRSTTTSQSTITRTAVTTIRSTATSTKTKTTEKCTSTGLASRATGGWDYIKVQGEAKCVPVLDFFCVDDLFDQMCTSMCQGIRDQRQHNPQNVLSDRAILLHRRMGRNEAAACRTMGCAQRLTWSGLYQQYFSMQCDEFPPASSMEGGGPTVTCISWYQNNLGGVFLRNFYDDLGLNQDDPYVIRMDTCNFPATPVSYPRGSEPRPHPRRQTDGGGQHTVQAAHDPLWVRDPRTKSEGYVLMPLEASGPGTYNATLSLSKADRLEGVSVVDGAGGLVWDGAGGSSFADGQRSFQYQVHDDTQDLFVAAKAATSVSVSAAFAATSVPQATATTPSDSAASGLMHSGGVFPKGLLVGVVVGIIMWV